jgi:hypothetical protein
VSYRQQDYLLSSFVRFRQHYHPQQENDDVKKDPVTWHADTGMPLLFLQRS